MIYIQKEGLSDDLNRKIIEIRKSETWKNIERDNEESIRQVFDNEFPKSEVKAVLIREQRGLCAYCMKIQEVSCVCQMMQLIKYTICISLAIHWMLRTRIY